MDSNLNYAVIGYPIAHTMSPFIHKNLLEIIGLEENYGILEISPENFLNDFSKLRSLSRFKGCNVTIPFKQSVANFGVDKLDDRAALYQAVNTVKFGETVVGYNTDCFGFLKALQGADIDLKGDVLVCGSGGVSRMIAFESVMANCNVTIGVRNSGLESAEKLKAEILSKFPDASVEYSLYDDIDKEFSLLVNGTPVGMYPKENFMPVSDKLLSKCANVYDCIYNPKNTMLVSKARANGARAESGMSMLVWQAAKAQTVWNDYEFTQEEIMPIIEKANCEMERLFR